MNESQSHNSRLVAAAFVLGAFLIFAQLGRLPLTLPDESRNSQVAREMKMSGNWLVPTYNGLPYLDKPAFYFKTVALSLSLLGETEAAARFSSAASGFLLLVITFLFVRREYSLRTGALAVMVMATSPLLLAFSRLVIFDMMLALFVCGAIFAGYIAEQSDGRARRAWYLVAAASAALATLVKGPVGFLVPGLVLGIYHALGRRWGALKRFVAPLNLVVFFGLTLPWFFGVNHYHNDFAYYGLVKESFQRYTSPEFRRTGPIYYYGPWILIGLFTWTLLLPESIAAAWRARRQLHPTDRLLIVWAIVVIAMFSLSKSKLPHYILSAIVALDVLIARVLTRGSDGLLRRGTLMLGVFCLLGAGLLFTAAVRPDLFGKIGRQVDADLAVALRQMSLALLLGALAAAVTWWRGTTSVAAVFVLVPVLFIALGFGAVRWYAEMKSGRALSDALPPLPAQTRFAGIRCFPTGLPFYRKQFVNVFTDDGDELTSNYIIFILQKTDPWPANVTRLKDRDAWLAAQPTPVMLFARRGGVKELEVVAAARGATVTNFVGGWSGALLPVPGGQ